MEHNEILGMDAALKFINQVFLSVESDPEEDMFIVSYLVIDDIGLLCYLILLNCAKLHISQNN